MDRLQKMFELTRNYNKILNKKHFIYDINFDIDKNLTINDIVIQHNIIQHCITNKINPYDLLQMYIKYNNQLKKEA